MIGYRASDLIGKWAAAQRTGNSSYYMEVLAQQKAAGWQPSGIESLLMKHLIEKELL
jgi:hypothetical protein